MRAALIAVLLWAGACSSLPAAPERVWMSKRVSEGKQCEPYEKSDFLAKVRDEGIAVHDSRTEPMRVCQACSVCPAYAAEIYILIDEQQADRARAAGFELSAPPPVEK